MTVEVRLRPEAEQDVAEAALWYEANEPGLGAQFVDLVKNAEREALNESASDSFVNR